MNIKGSATIELRDLDGNIVTKLKSDNLVTNAVKNYLTGVANIQSKCTYDKYSEKMYNITGIPRGIVKDLFGGVMLFGKSIVSDVDHILPNAEEIDSFLGCGNLDGSRTGDIYKGAFNEPESYFNKDSARFVWDFTTSQANGDIRAICLTSNMGGDHGYGLSSLGLHNKDICPLTEDASMFTNKFGDAGTADSYAEAALARFGRLDIKPWLSGGVLRAFDRTTKFSVNMDKLLGYYGIGFNSTPSDQIIPTDITSEAGTFTKKALAFSADKSVSILSSYVSNTKLLTLDVYSGNFDMSQIVVDLSNLETQVPLDSLSLDGVSVIGDYLYIVGSSFSGNTHKACVAYAPLSNTSAWTVVNIPSSLLSVIVGTSTSRRDISMWCIRGIPYVCIASGTSGVCCLIQFNNNILSDKVSYQGIKRLGVLVSCGSANIVSDVSIKEPYSYIEAIGDNYMGYNSVKASYVPVINWKYLATINNLGTVINKTADRTLKVIYDLSLN